MTALQCIELPGLRGHHPLGFLAACGLLRACTGWPGYGRPELAWTKSQTSGEFIAVLFGERKFDMPTLTEVIDRRSKQTRESPAFTWSSKVGDRDKYRRTARDLLDRERDDGQMEALAVLAALASDGVSTDGSLRSSKFDTTSGNQRFLESICVLAGRPEKEGAKPHPISEDAVREALVGPWRYRDDHHALGWDPGTQRLHALRGKLPEKDKSNRSVRAAVFLATQALPLFPCFSRGSRLYTTGFYREGAEDWFSWPIWPNPISLDTLRSLLTHPFTADLRHRGVELVYCCRRVRTGGTKGDYQVFGHAEARQWPPG